MDSAQWMQEIGQKSMREIGDPSASSCARPSSVERKSVRPQKDQAANCPRCHSTNTKFCYYNNYSLTQPRYFCKTCRRYWTEGGTLRNVPVGGGSRKNKKSSLISTSSSLSMAAIPSTQTHKLPDLNPPSISEFSNDHQNPKSHHHHEQGQDLNLGYVHAPHEYSHVGIPQFFEFPKIFDPSRDHVMNSSSSSSSSSYSASLSALNLLRNGTGLNSFIPIAPGNLETNSLFASSFQFNQESKPALGFSFDHHVNGSRLYTNPSVSQEHITNGSLGFPFGAMKRNSSANDDQAGDQTKGQENANGYWTGMLGGGSW